MKFLPTQPSHSSHQRTFTSQDFYGAGDNKYLISVYYQSTSNGHLVKAETLNSNPLILAEIHCGDSQEITDLIHRLLINIFEIIPSDAQPSFVDCLFPFHQAKPIWNDPNMIEQLQEVIDYYGFDIGAFRLFDLLNSVHD